MGKDKNNKRIIGLGLSGMLDHIAPKLKLPFQVDAPMIIGPEVTSSDIHRAIIPAVDVSIVAPFDFRSVSVRPEFISDMVAKLAPDVMARSIPKESGTGKTYTIKKSRFLEWYFESGQDSENMEIREQIAQRVIGTLFQENFSIITTKEIFDLCNKDAIKLYFLEEFDLEEVGDSDEFGDLVEDCCLMLIEG